MSFGPREECGVFGIFGKSNCSTYIYYGLSALQHRGQESAGIATCANGEINLSKGMGLVSSIFDEKSVLELPGDSGIGHVRYSTSGESRAQNAQPFISSGKIEFAIAHNGNLVNYWALRENWIERGHNFATTTDTEVMSKIIAYEYEKEGDMIKAIKNTARYLDGSYSCVILTKEAIYAFRDPFGFRPLLMANLPNGYAFASEDCAFAMLPSKVVRDVKPGEIIKVSKDGMSSDSIAKINRKSYCMFEYVYFARPDSTLNGVSVYKSRKEMGRMLARSFPAKADIVSAVPYSGVAAALGYSEESGVPYTEILLRNRYAGRSFIMPEQGDRERAVRTKLIPIGEEIRGKRIVLIDDSIVRGTTIKQIAKMLYEAGAKEIHLRIACPPIVAPCFYGVDMQQFKQFIANEKTVEEIAEFTGVDSMAYNTIENLVAAIGIAKESLCMACLDEEYPTELADIRARQTRLNELGQMRL